MPNYINRELSWLEFNKGVLSLANDNGIPLFERLKFLGISASNLDEFFMVRVASIKDLVNAKHKNLDISGNTPNQQLKSIRKSVMEFNALQDKIHYELIDALEDVGVEHVCVNDIKDEEILKPMKEYFMSQIYPLLTPVIIQPDKKFPLISNLDIHLLVNLKHKSTGQKAVGIVRIPKSIPSIYSVKYNGSTLIINMDDLVEFMIGELFTSHTVTYACIFRIIRNAELEIDDDDASDLLLEIESKIKKRKWGEIIKLEVDSSTPDFILKYLKKHLKVDKSKIYYTEGFTDLTYVNEIYNLPGFDRFKYNKFKHVYPKRYGLTSQSNMFEKISEHGSMLLHHPYDSFLPVSKFIKQASEDPDVLAIKQTLYRVSKDSPIVKSLMKAAKSGKEVTVVVELKARFDEERNIEWARKLERAGCTVIYGVPKLKVHSKVCLVLRKENDDITYYTHLGTGNYNDSTAKQYTDISMLTCDKNIGVDAASLFNYISGEAKPTVWNSLVVSPDNVRDTILTQINNELERVRNGNPGYIIIKVNSLNDKEIIDALYKASEEGVYVHLIVRGICSVGANTPTKEKVERFKVSSIIGEYLEHSRIFYFYNGGNPTIYCGSADMMPRNLDKRIEVLFPITTNKEQLYIELMLKIYMCCKARYLCSNNKYEYCSDTHRDPQKLIRNIHGIKLDNFHIQASDVVAPILGYTQDILGFHWETICNTPIDVEEPDAVK